MSFAENPGLINNSRLSTPQHFIARLSLSHAKFSAGGGELRMSDELLIKSIPSAPPPAPYLASFGSPPALDQREPRASAVRLEIASINDS